MNMKKTVSLLTAFLFLATSVIVLAQAGGERRATRRGGGDRAARQNQNRRGGARMLERQIETLKTQQEKDLVELKAIHKVAVEEKATKTAQQLANLIEKRQNDYSTRLAALEKRLQAIRERLAASQVLTADSDKKAPDFTLSTFDGKPVKLSDYRGKTVVLEWLNFECPFSKYHYATKPTMVELAKKYKNQNVVWLTVNSTSHTTPQANHIFAKQYKVKSLILDDRSGKVGKAYAAKTTPHMYIINARGNIVYEGAIDNAPLGKTKPGQEYVNYVDKALVELTGGKAISTPNTKAYGCSVKYPK